jgi:hypothetical protein
MFVFILVHLDRQKPSQDGFACTLFIVVNELPRGALVEKQVVMHTGRIRKVDLDDGGITLESHRPVFSEGELLLFDMAKLEQTDWIWRSSGHTGWELILAKIRSSRYIECLHNDLHKRWR